MYSRSQFIQRVAPKCHATRSLMVRAGAAFRTTFDDAYETSAVDEAFLNEPCENFLILRVCDLWRLIIHLTSTRQSASFLPMP